MKPTMSELREQLLSVSHALHQNGWVANHDGNVTVRAGEDRYLATPTSVSKGDVRDEWLIVVNGEGKVVQGTYRPFSEFVLHRAAYETRVDVNAVVHAHPPTATAFSVAGRGLDRPILAEAVVSIGPRVPLVPYALPGSDAFTDEVARQLPTYDCLILQNHGVLTVGSDLQQAYLRMELVEHLAKIELLTTQLGGVGYLDAGDIDALLDKRKKAGLGPEARGMVDPHRGAGPALSREDRADLKEIIAEELRSLLGR